MIFLYKIALAVSSLAFVFYGFNCLFSKEMINEFKRFGLTDGQRKLTGTLQLAGGIGLAMGYFTSMYLVLLAAVGLCVLMIMGFIVRLRIKDSVYQSLPSLLLALLNLYIVIMILSGITP